MAEQNFTAGQPTLMKTIKQPAFLLYTFSLLASAYYQIPIQNCTTWMGVDGCAIINVFTILAGCLYAGTQFSQHNRRTGWLCLITAGFTKLLSYCLIANNTVPSLLISLVICVLNLTMHVFDIIGQ